MKHTIAAHIVHGGIMETQNITLLDDIVLVQNETDNIATIPDSAAMVKTLTIENHLTDFQIVSFIEAELQNELPAAEKKYCFDYETVSHDDNQCNITVVIAYQETIDRYCNALLEKNIILTQINIASYKKINLLPWRKIRQRKYFRNLMLRCFLYGTICILASVCLKLFLSQAAHTAQFKIQTIKKDTHAIHWLKDAKKNQQLLQMMQTQYPEKINAHQENSALQKKLLLIANTLPNSITLQSLTITAKKILLTGIGNHLSDIHLYHDALQKNKIGRQVTLSDIHNDTQNPHEMIFTIQAPL